MLSVIVTVGTHSRIDSHAIVRLRLVDTGMSRRLSGGEATYRRDEIVGVVAGLGNGALAPDLQHTPAFWAQDRS